MVAIEIFSDSIAPYPNSLRRKRVAFTRTTRFILARVILNFPIALRVCAIRFWGYCLRHESGVAPPLASSTYRPQGMHVAGLLKATNMQSTQFWVLRREPRQPQGRAPRTRSLYARN